MLDSEFKKRYIAARNKIIADEFTHLNDMQRKAVLATEGPLLLLAGAGSGKTTVLINRIANILRFGRGSDTGEIPSDVTEKELEFIESYAKKPVNENLRRAHSLCAVDSAEPWRVIAITFTNKAAEELKSRLERMLGPEAGDIWASTFHSACVRMLRRDISRLGYSQSFTIYDTSDSLSLIKRILKEFALDEKTYQPRSVLSQISRLKDDMQSPADYADAAEKSFGDVRKKSVSAIYAEYEKRLKAANSLDFDDIILLTVKLLISYPDIRDYYQRKFRYVLVDEYQDTNKLQYMLVKLLSGVHGNICVVGDDDQSIYRFRGATIANILSFEDEYSDARVIRLEQNYRSTGHILEAANAVIKNNTERKSKTLWTELPRGEKLTLYVAENEDDEAQFVSGRILAGISEGANFRDYAVLYRMNVQSNRLEHAFRRNAIPYRVFGGMKFFDRAEIKDILAYLCVLNNPSDEIHLARIINTPPRGIGPTTVERAQETALSKGISLFDALKACREQPELQRSAGKLILFTNMLDELRKSLDTVPLDSFYDLLIEKTGYIRALEEKNTEENNTRADNVRELKTNIISYVESSENPTLSGFLNEIALYADLDQLSAADDAAVIMTMHSAKGLEFPAVFIVGAEDGLFPSLRSIGSSESIEEERRLCYVAMTRAKKKLYITCARQRMLYGRTSSSLISRFVDEIPAEHLDKPVRQYVQYGYTETERRSTQRTSDPHRCLQPAATSAAPIKKPAPPALSLSFTEGDTVEHRAFGRGLLVSLKSMPGDALIEIEFEKAGRKKLMLKSASQFMKKTEP